MLELVGIRYAEKGLTPAEGFSCWGVVRFALMKYGGVDLPERAIHPHRWPEFVTIHRPPLPKLQRLDIPMFSEIIPTIVNHMGIMCDESNFIHAGHLYGGVVCEPILRYYDKIVAIGRPKL